MTTENTQLIAADNDRIKLALTEPMRLDEMLREVRAKLDAFRPDITTDKGRKEIASIAHKVARTKTSIDTVGKDAVAGIKAQVKVIDRARKTARDTLDAWRDEVRMPLTIWEEGGKAADSAIEELERISALAGLRDLVLIDEHVERIAELEPMAWREDRADAVREACRKASTIMQEARAATEKMQAEAEDLERLREAEERRIADEERAEREREIEARAKLEQAEAARREIEAAKERERMAEQRARMAEEQAKRDAEAAERARAEAEEQARRREQEAREQEAARLRAEAEAKAEEERRRAANEEHRRAVMNRAHAELVGAGVEHSNAVRAVQAIADGVVRSVVLVF